MTRSTWIPASPDTSATPCSATQVNVASLRRYFKLVHPAHLPKPPAASSKATCVVLVVITPPVPSTIRGKARHSFPSKARSSRPTTASTSSVLGCLMIRTVSPWDPTPHEKPRAYAGHCSDGNVALSADDKGTSPRGSLGARAQPSAASCSTAKAMRLSKKLRLDHRPMPPKVAR